MHDHSVKGKSNRLITTIVINVVITAAQIIGGILSGSLALISDALHNLSDATSLLISLIGIKLSQRENTTKRTYGFQRAEIISALFNAVILIIIAVILFSESISRFKNPEQIDSRLVIILGIAGIILNALCVFILEKDSHHSLNLKSAYIHLFTDMLTSVAVTIGGVCIYYYNLLWIDALLCMMISIYLSYISIKLLWDSIKILMLFTPEGYNLDEIVKTINVINGIKNVHHVHLWRLNDNSVHFQAHIDLMENMRISEFENILKTIHDKLHQLHIDHINIQPELKFDDDKNIIVQDLS